MSELELLPLDPRDFDSWLPLWRAYQAFYRVEIPEATTRVTFERFLDPLEPMHAVLARRRGSVLGLVHFIEHRSCWTSGNYVYLQDLFVVPEARGIGVGRALIEHVYEAAAAAGCSRVHWLTHESNTEAMKLYDRTASRSGFIQYRKILAG